MKNVLIRTLSGIIYIALFVGSLFAGGYWFWWFTVVLLFIAVYEYLRLVQAHFGEKASAIIYVPVALGAFCLNLFSFNVIWAYYSIGLLCLFFLFWPILICAMVCSRLKDPISTLGNAFLAIPYIAIPLTMLNIVYRMPFGMELILISLVAIWVNDTGAYCVGCTFGRHRLCERLSPKKSWEGFWGGFAFVVLGMVIFALCKGYNCYTITIFGIYGAVISVLATFGDLYESMLKRRAGVKDSGKIIPGHGGVLDRIDSLLLVSYAIVIMEYILQILKPFFNIPL